MDHDEAVRTFEHLMIREADHAHETATELEAWFRCCPVRNLDSSHSFR
jgi:hypothetical protein